MPFLTGKTTFRRFGVGDGSGMSLETALERLAEHAAGRQRMMPADGIGFGWSGGSHVLDTEFTLEKNTIENGMVFAMRVDMNKPPADLLKAYYATDLKALAKDNPSGRPSAMQKRTAKESARDRLEDEARDGRFTKRKLFEVLWDFRSNEVLFGTTSFGQDGRLRVLFKNTFGLELEPKTAGRIGRGFSDDDAEFSAADPSPFLPGLSAADVAWCPDDASKDFLGNEFVLWLWWLCEEGTAEVKLSDGTIATVFFANDLTLSCPRGQTGSEAFKHEGPTRMPEAMRGVQSGKLPRRAGLMIDRQGSLYGGRLFAEDMAWGGVKFPVPEEGDSLAQRDERVGHVRDFIETSDLLYGAFLAARFGGKWDETVGKMTEWLMGEAVAV